MNTKLLGLALATLSFAPNAKSAELIPIRYENEELVTDCNYDGVQMLRFAQESNQDIGLLGMDRLAGDALWDTGTGTTVIHQGYVDAHSDLFTYLGPGPSHPVILRRQRRIS